MSIELIRSVWHVNVGSASTKFVLMKLADNANDEGVCWPSYQSIANHCDMGRRMVIEHIKKLEAMGLVTRQRRQDGESNRSNVFVLTLGQDSAPPGEADHTTLVNNTSPRGGEIDFTQNPHTGNPQKNPQGTKGINDYKPDDVSDETWDDFVAHRKGIKRPLTVSAAKRLKRKLDELRKQGSEPEEVLNQSILNGWQGVFPVKSQKKQTNEPTPSSWYDRHDVVEY